MLYSVKVKHRRFLDDKEAERLKSFGITVVLNNHVYREYSSHMVSKVEMDSEQVNELLKAFKCSVDADVISIDMEK
jgi:hypothetical protein